MATKVGKHFIGFLTPTKKAPFPSLDTEPQTFATSIHFPGQTLSDEASTKLFFAAFPDDFDTVLRNSGGAFLAPKNRRLPSFHPKRTLLTTLEMRRLLLFPRTYQKDHAVTSSSLPVDLDKWDTAKSLLVLVVTTVRNRGADALFTAQYILSEYAFTVEIML